MNCGNRHGSRPRCRPMHNRSRSMLRDLWHISAHSMRASGSTAIIAELLTTFTGHSRASLCSLDPIVAFWTLFELGSSYKLNEILIIFVKTVIYAVLCTSHSIMVKTLTFQAIMVVASWAFIVI